MKKKIAVCGLDCSVCPAHIAYRDERPSSAGKNRQGVVNSIRRRHPSRSSELRRLHDLHGVHIGHCFECAIRKCGLEKNVANCGVCADYGCSIVGPFIEKVPQAKANLEEIRAALPR